MLRAHVPMTFLIGMVSTLTTGRRSMRLSLPEPWIRSTKSNWKLLLLEYSDRTQWPSKRQAAANVLHITIDVVPVLL